MDMRSPELKVKVAELQYARLLELGHYDEAVRMLVVRVALATLAFGAQSFRVAQAYLTLGKAYLDWRELPAQALQHAQRARRVYDLVVAQDGLPLTLLETDIFHVIGLAEMRMGNLAAAEKALLKAETLYASVPDAHDLVLERTLARSLGSICARKAQFDHAAKFLTTAVRLVETHLGTECEELIELLQELGDVERRRGLDAEATALHDRALAVADKVQTFHPSPFSSVFRPSPSFSFLLPPSSCLPPLVLRDLRLVLLVLLRALSSSSSSSSSSQHHPEWSTGVRGGECPDRGLSGCLGAPAHRRQARGPC